MVDNVAFGPYARSMATDRDRFGHRLGTRWKRIGDLLVHSPSEAPQLLADYVDSALLGLLNRTGFQHLLQLLARADELRDTRLLRTDDPEYASKIAAIQDSEPRAAQMALEALRVADASNGLSALDALAGVAVRWVSTQCAIQKPYASDRQLQEAVLAHRSKAEEIFRIRLQARARQQRLHKPQRRSKTLSLLHRDVVVIPL
jgi:hypothetical protein